MTKHRHALPLFKPAAALCLAVAMPGIGVAQEGPGAERASGSPSSARQSLDDAWWTGPIIANSPATLPKGHGYVESYLFDVKTQNRDSINSLTFIQYGLTDTLTVGLIPTFGYNRIDSAPDSSGVGIGDVTLMANYRLSKYRPGRWTPSTSISIQHSLPTGKHDRLGTRPDGFGSGAHTTTLGFYGQAYFWMPNGRILRGRLNLTQSFSSHADIEDASVYGTAAEFRGRAKPGNAFFVDYSWEYSLTRSWVLAVDLAYRHDNRTRVFGNDGTRDIRFASPPGDAFIIAPAIEYSWTAKHGVLLGVRYIPAHKAVPRSITPVMALSIFI